MLALEFHDRKLFQVLAGRASLLSIHNVGRVYHISRAYKLKEIETASLEFILKHFSELVRNKEILLSIKPRDHIFQIYMNQKGEEGGMGRNWLDVLWYAHHCGREELKLKAVENLRDMINIENVIPTLIGAHHSGCKEVKDERFEVFFLINCV